jgi:hypothetical protein
MSLIRILLIVVSVSVVLNVSADEQLTTTAPGPEIDRMTERVLLDACGYLRSADRFTVNVEATYEDVLTTGTRVEYSRQASVVLKRPDHLRIDSESDKGRRSFFYDGKAVTVYHPDERVYAVFEAPPTIDATIEDAEARGLSMPASDLMMNHPCQALGDHLQTGTYAGRHYLDGDWYHHLLLSTNAADVQLWVASGDASEIRKLVITYTSKPGEPQYRALLRDWDFDPAIDSTTFTFTPPADARKVEFWGSDTAQGGEK